MGVQYFGCGRLVRSSACSVFPVREARSFNSKHNLCFILVSGINGEVTLLHPDQLVSYDEFSINPVMENYCTALCFHPHLPTILFCKYLCHFCWRAHVKNSQPETVEFRAACRW